MEIIRKKPILGEVNFGTVVRIPNDDYSSSNLENVWIVLDDSVLDKCINFPKNTESKDFVLCANLSDGFVQYYKTDTIVELLDAKIELNY